jgi:hypothetical protein
MFFSALLFLFSVYCGLQLIQRNFYNGLILSVYNNALQVLSIGIIGFHFNYVSGVFAGLILDLTDDFIFGLGFEFSSIMIGFEDVGELILININIFAIIVLGFIFRMKDKIEKKIKTLNTLKIN